MAVTDSNVLVGIAQAYIAPAQTSSPTWNANGTVVTPTSPWVAQGGTESGVTLTVDAKIDMIRVEEQPTPAAVVPDTVDVTVDITFSEDILQNALTAYGMATLTTVAATSTQPAMTVLTLANGLTTFALALVGQNTFGLNRLVYIPNVSSGGKVKTSYKRTKTPRMYPTTFSAICPLPSIAITDATAIAT